MLILRTTPSLTGDCWRSGQDVRVVYNTPNTAAVDSPIDIVRPGEKSTKTGDILRAGGTAGALIIQGTPPCTVGKAHPGCVFTGPVRPLARSKPYDDAESRFERNV